MNKDYHFKKITPDEFRVAKIPIDKLNVLAVNLITPILKSAIKVRYVRESENYRNKPIVDVWMQYNPLAQMNLPFLSTYGVKKNVESFLGKPFQGKALILDEPLSSNEFEDFVEALHRKYSFINGDHDIDIDVNVRNLSEDFNLPEKRLYKNTCWYSLESFAKQ